MIPYIKLQELNSEDEIYSNEKWGLILSSKDIPRATPKTNYIDIPGGDGSIDLTEATGEVKYNDRTLTFVFTMLDSIKDREKKLEDIANYLSGKKFKITTWDDLDYYYIGRIQINEFKTNKSIGLLTLEANCEPYKYKRYKTTYIYEINGLKSILVPNERKRVIPLITTSSEMLITYQDNTYSLSKGTHQVLNIYFDRGIYELNVEGNGTLTIEFQEGSL